MKNEEITFSAESEDTHFYHVARREILAKELDKLNLKDLEILDLGCGSGGNIRLLERYGVVDGLDISELAIHYAKDRGFRRLYVGDARNLKNFTQRYDLVVAFDLLEHMEDDISFLKQVRELLTDNGYLLIAVPAHQWLWSQHDEVLHHIRRYDKGIAKKFEVAGYRIVKLEWYNALNIPIRLIQKVLERFRTEEKSWNVSVSKRTNSLLISLLKLERKLRVPFGSGLYVIARRI